MAHLLCIEYLCKLAKKKMVKLDPTVKGNKELIKQLKQTVTVISALILAYKANV